VEKITKRRYLPMVRFLTYIEKITKRRYLPMVRFQNI